MPSRNSATILLVAAALSTCLSACKTKAEKPSPPPAPPEVKCDQAKPPRQEPPDWPDNFVVTGAPFALQLLGLIREERRVEAIEQKCIDDLRGKGVIQ